MPPRPKILVSLRRPHYLQACIQLSLFAYWGWYWKPVYSFAPWLLAQVLFAYLFDFAYAWARGRDYVLGFGNFPIVFSINLFIWFKPPYLWAQFALIAFALLAKDLLRWQRDGRRTHIFNPSSFPLAVVSVLLLATGTTNLTWGPEIATTQFYPPNMYLFLFALGLPGQFFFGVTPMTMSAVLTTYLFGLAYHATSGIYFFYDSYIPISVFLGMHLLFTDPATAPRSAPGRLLFGAIYGATTVILYQVLGRLGLPTFYDKLLQVPFMNLAVRAIDRYLPTPQVRRELYMPVWATAFALLLFFGGVGDTHPGQYIPFWRQACQDGRAFACPYLADLDQENCDRGSAWACNEAGLMTIALSRSGEDLRRQNATQAAPAFQKSCEMGFEVGCRNSAVLAGGLQNFAAAQPVLKDYAVLVRGSKGAVAETDSSQLLALACRQGWNSACNFKRID